LSEGCLRVRNRIYERVFDPNWVTTHMPDAEVRRQRAAYRRGLLRAAMIGGAVAVVMAMLALAGLARAQRAHRASRPAGQSRRLARGCSAGLPWTARSPPAATCMSPT